MFATLICIYCVVGLITNINLAYALSSGGKRTPWWLTAKFNFSYTNSRRRVGKFHYIAAFIAWFVASLICDFRSDDLGEIAVMLLNYYGLTTLPLWFFMERDFQLSQRDPPSWPASSPTVSDTTGVTDKTVEEILK